MWVVHPAYEGVSLKWSKENDGQYFVQSLDGEFTFNGDEAEIITSQSIYTKFWLVLIDLDTNEEMCRGLFRKTDCKVDNNHRSVKVNVEVDDIYKKLNDKKDEEYNVVDLGLDKKELNLWCYPVFQTYVRGDSSMAVFSRHHNSGRVVSCSVNESLSDLYDMYFGRRANGKVIGRLAMGFTVASGTFAGRYSTTTDGFIEYGTLGSLIATNENGYYIQLQRMLNYVVNEYNYLFKFYLVDPNDTVLDQFPRVSTEYIVGYEELLALDRITFVNVNVQLGFDNIINHFRIWWAGSRLLTKKKLSNTSNQGLIDNSVDIYPSDYVSGVRKFESVIRVSKRVSDTDKGYGKVANQDYYYDTPDNTNTYVPLYKESWVQGISVWAVERRVTASEIEEYKTQERVEDFYDIGDVIKALLGKIDTTINFEKDTSHSTFLFSTTNPISGDTNYPLYITQKSNILNLRYDYPAWKAPVKMSQILTFLQYAFNCYYDIYVDDNGDKQFRIEHIAFYNNGCSYSENIRSTLNLSQYYDAGNRKPLSYHTDHWEYSVEREPTRIEFSWMDTQSEIFEGFPIIVPERYRIFSDEQKEERTIDWFSADVDFLTSVHAECSSDGFCVVRGVSDWVEEGSLYLDGVEYRMQNISLSMVNLHRKFMLYDITAEKVYINGNETTPQTVIQRKMSRHNEVTFIKPRSFSLTPMVRMVTEAGVGVAESMECDLSDMKIITTLKYETES